MTDSNTPAPAGTADAQPESIRDIADSLPNDAFGFADEEGQGSSDEQGADTQPDPARSDRARQQTRGEHGRFASQGEPEGDGEADAAAEPEEGQEPAEGAPDAEGETAEAEAEADPKEKKTPSFSIEIDGQSYSAEDVRRGFLRQDDYTRKTQEVAQHRQQIQQENQRLQSHEQELVGILDITVAALRDTLPPQPDMALLDSDPIAYSRQMAQHQAGVQRLQALAGQQQQLGQRQSAQQQESARQEAAQRHARRVEAQQNLREMMPALFTEQGQSEFFGRVEKHGKALGLSRQDVVESEDPRVYRTLDFAMKYLDLQAKKPAAVQRVQQAPPIRPAARPGAGTRNGQVRQDAARRFVENPSIKSALDTGVLDDVFG